MYKSNTRGFEIDYEYSHGATTHMVTMSDRDMNSHMNLVVSDGVAVPKSISGTTGAEHSYSHHIVDMRNNYYDVDAFELNLPIKNRVVKVSWNRWNSQSLAVRWQSLTLTDAGDATKIPA